MPSPQDDELLGAFSIEGFGATYHLSRTITYELIKKRNCAPSKSAGAR